MICFVSTFDTVKSECNAYFGEEQQKKGTSHTAAAFLSHIENYGSDYFLYIPDECLDADFGIAFVELVGRFE